MSELKAELEVLGFTDVSTYLNSGNVVFASETEEAKPIIEKMIAERFGLVIPVYVIEMNDLKEILLNSPEWWDSGDKDKYDNLIFILYADTPEDICAYVGETTDGLEKIKQKTISKLQKKRQDGLKPQKKSHHTERDGIKVQTQRRIF